MKATDVWSFHNYTTNTPSNQYHTCISTLKDLETVNHPPELQNNARKSELLYDVFFQCLPNNDYVNDNYIYPPSVYEFELITNQQIYQAILKLSTQGTWPK